jgi:hypothetical protein
MACGILLPGVEALGHLQTLLEMGPGPFLLPLGPEQLGKLAQASDQDRMTVGKSPPGYQGLMHGQGLLMMPDRLLGFPQGLVHHSLILERGGQDPMPFGELLPGEALAGCQKENDGQGQS